MTEYSPYKRTPLLLLFLFLVALCVVCLPVSADNDCNPANSATFDGVVFSNSETADCTANGTANLKLKRLADINMGVWSGDVLLEGLTPTASDSRRFCILAYNELSSRVVHNYTITANSAGDAVNGEFVLRQGANTLPVTLRIQGQRPAVSTIDLGLEPNIAISIQANSTRTACKDYEFVIQAQVNRNDVFTHDASGLYQGTFVLDVFSFVGGTFLQVQEDFVVSVNIIPVFQVNKLDDVTLDVSQTTSDGRIFDDMHFCVFAMGGRHYRMSLSSQMRPTQPFTLDNGTGQTIPYRARVLLDNGNWGDFTGPGSTADGALQGHDTLNCDGGENSLIRIDFAGADMPVQSGVYQDVMEIVVGPE